MTPRHILNTLSAILRSDNPQTVHLYGPPGCGKTALCSQVAKATRLQALIIALPTCEAVDLRGMPQIVNGRTSWASPLPRDGEGVLVLDEVSSAAPDVQVAAHHLAWREVGSDMCLPPGWRVVMTGNRAQDRTVYRSMSGPLRNRVTLIEVEPSPDDWRVWAMANGIKPDVTGFIKWRPNLLTCKEIPQEGAFPSPRAWAQASTLLSLSGLSAAEEKELMAGTVGTGEATEFCAYLRLCRELPDILKIVANQDTAEVPTSPSVLYALVTSLSMHTRSTGESAMLYVSRMPAEMGLLYVRDIRDYYDLKTDQHIRRWIGQHKSMFKDED